MRTDVEETVQPCPECGAEIRVDSRFTTWCSACDWNVDPSLSEEDEGRLETLRRALARRHGEQLLAEMSAGQERRAGQDVAGVVAFGIAVVVHGMTVVLAAGGIWLVASGWMGAGMVLGLFLLALAWTLRPRLSRLPEDGRVLRADAPELYGLIDEVARVVGTGGVDVVAVNAEVNASVMPYGVRGRLLTLGLPLWEILTPQQRIALLGHELGHYSNGDTRRGLVVGTAYRSLTTWRFYVDPIANPSLVEMLINCVYVVPRSVVQGILILLDQLTVRAAQRCEYLADSMAARAGSTEAAVELMDKLLVVESVATTLRREVNHRRLGRRGGPVSRGRSSGEESMKNNPAEGLWEALADHVSSIPDHEYERQRRVGARRGHSVDSTHPPTHLRRQLLLGGVYVTASVVADDDQARRITAELEGARTSLARQVVRDGFDGS
ncbi:M48 family metallopeptidase [Streptomyces sp. NPDC046862]|uniref:M48 family metallopeptidase n=1 Tax=Streptomyces sp. NPDC046862 TaxID=3154603 RepID=UPI00345318F2